MQPTILKEKYAPIESDSHEEKFRVIETKTREEWLELRRHYITATDIARLATLNQAEWDRVRAEKNGEIGFTGNDATEWGNQREPHIVEWLQANVDPTLQANDQLCVNLTRPYMAATPDTISIDGKVSVQIKTSNKPLAPIDAPQKYIDQCLWEKATLEAETMSLAIEEHKNMTEIVGTLCDEVPDNPERLAFLIEVAERFLAGGPAVEETEEDELSAAIEEWGKLKDAENELKGKIADARKRVESLIGKKPGKWSAGGYVVALSKPIVRNTIDTNAVKADFPEIAEKCTVSKTQNGILSIKAAA